MWQKGGGAWQHDPGLHSEKLIFNLLWISSIHFLASRLKAEMGVRKLSSGRLGPFQSLQLRWEGVAVQFQHTEQEMHRGCFIGWFCWCKYKSHTFVTNEKTNVSISFYTAWGTSRARCWARPTQRRGVGSEDLQGEYQNVSMCRACSTLEPLQKQERTQMNPRHLTACFTVVSTS